MQKSMLLACCLTILPALGHAEGYLGISSGILVNTTNDVELPYPHGHRAVNYRQVPLTFFAGYGVEMQSAFYLGGEIFVTPCISELSSSSWGNYLNMTHQYGLSFLPGVQVGENTIAYTRLGWVGAHFEHQHTNANGGQLGFGLKTRITQHLDIRAEYSITTFSIDNEHARVKVFPLYGTSAINADQFAFGLSYRFG